MPIMRDMAHPGAAIQNPTVIGQNIDTDPFLGGAPLQFDTVTTPFGIGQPVFKFKQGFNVLNWMTPFATEKAVPDPDNFNLEPGLETQVYSRGTKCVATGFLGKLYVTGTGVGNPSINVFNYQLQGATDLVHTTHGMSYSRVLIFLKRTLSGEYRFILEIWETDLDDPAPNGVVPNHSTYTKTIQCTSAIACPIDKWAHYAHFVSYDPNTQIIRSVFVVNDKEVWDYSHRPMNFADPQHISFIQCLAGVTSDAVGGAYVTHAWCAADVNETNETRDYNPYSYIMPAFECKRAVTTDSILSVPTGVLTKQLSEASPTPIVLSFNPVTLPTNNAFLVVPRVHCRDANGLWVFSVRPDDRLGFKMTMDGETDQFYKFVGNIKSGTKYSPPLFCGSFSWDEDTTPPGIFYTTAGNFVSMKASGAYTQTQVNSTKVTLTYEDNAALFTDFGVDFKYAELLIASEMTVTLDDPFSGCPWITPNDFPSGVQSIRIPDTTLVGPEQAVRLARSDIVAVLNGQMPIVQKLLERFADNTSTTNLTKAIFNMNGHRILNAGSPLLDPNPPNIAQVE